MIIPDVLLTPFAQSGDRATIPQEDSSGFINFTDGYTPFYEISLTANNPQAKAVERQGMNELFYQLSQNAMAWQQMSIAPWLSGTSGGYATNAQVARLGSDNQARIYRSLIDNNTSDPLTNSSQWELQPRWSAMRANIAMPAGGGSYLDNSRELISATSGIDANTMLTGTWEFTTDAAAQACANMPTLFGSNVVRGMFESKSWTVGAQTVAVQRYTSVDGRQFIRGNNGAQWFAWSVVILPADVQSNRMTFTPITIGSGGVYSGTLTPALTSFRDGQILWVYVTNKNPDGAVVLTLNGGTGYPIVNETAHNPLAGELYGGVCLMWEASNNRWRIVTGMGIKSQSFDATADYHLPTFLQVKNLISAQGKPDWTDVQNKPLVVINGNTAQLLSIELIPASAGAAFIDFHYGIDNADFNVRLVNDANGRVAFYTSGQAKPTAYFDGNGIHSDIGISTGGVLHLTGVTNSAIYFENGSGALKYLIGDNNSTGLDFNAYNGSSGATAMRISPTGVVSFLTNRPIFATGTPWDTGNFDPNTKVTLNGVNTSMGTRFSWGGNGSISQQSSGSSAPYNAINNQIVVTDNANPAATACITFLKEQSFGCVLGLDTDNVMKIGGWSYGAVAYPILHTGNLAANIGVALAANAYNAVGQYGLFVANMGTGSGLVPIVPGALAAGSQLIYCATGYIPGYNSGYQVTAPGTWQCCSWLYNGDGGSTDSIGIFRRVS